MANIELNCMQISPSFFKLMNEINYQYTQGLINRDEFINKATSEFMQYLKFNDIKLVNIIHIISE